MSDAREVHAEQLIGRRVRSASGVVLGRIEEMCVETVNGEAVVVEFHLGAAAFVERVAGFTAQLPFLGWLRRRRGLRVGWQDLDLSDARHPVARAWTPL